MNWISMNDRLPEIGCDVLVYDDRADIITVGKLATHDKVTKFTDWMVHPYVYQVRITHWMPLPEPPKEGE